MNVEFAGVDANAALAHDKLYFVEAHGGFKPDVNQQPMVERVLAAMPPTPEGSRWEVNPSDGPGVSYIVAGKRIKAGGDIAGIKQVDAIRIPLRLVRTVEE
jgi:hypothetical protein